MDEMQQAIEEIEAAQLGAERWRTARRLLDRVEANGSLHLTHAELCSLTGCEHVQAALRHLTVLAKADIIHFSTNERVYVTFRAWTRSSGASTRSNGASTRSNGASTRSNGAPTRSYGAPTRSYVRSNGASTRSNGASTRSNGASTRSNGAPTRSNGALPERKTSGEENADVIDLSIYRSIDLERWIEQHGQSRTNQALRTVAAQRGVRKPAAYVEKLLRSSVEMDPREDVAAEVAGEAQHVALDATPCSVAEVAEEDVAAEDAAAWRKALAELQLQLASSTCATWLAGVWLAEVRADGTFVLATTNTYGRDWLQSRLLAMVRRTLANVVGRPVEVEFVVRRRNAA